MKNLLVIVAFVLCTFAIPAEAQTIVNQWPTGGSFAGGLDYDPGTDTVWLADENDVVIRQYDRNGNLLVTFAAPRSMPIGVGVDPTTGNIWIGDESEYVDEVTPAGVPTGRSWPTTPTIVDVSGVAVDPVTGHVFVSQDAFPQMIAEFDQNGVPIKTIDLTGAGSADPDGLGYNPATLTFLLGEDIGDQIIEVDLLGNFLGSWNMGALGVSPEGVGLDAVAGTVFISDGFGNMVYEVADIIDPAGVSLKADATQISGRLGGIVNFSLSGGNANAGRDYLMLGCVSGTMPGTLLPGGMATLPLNLDYFTFYVIYMINTPVFDNFMATLDKAGLSKAQLNTIGLGNVSHGCIGTTLYFAFALSDPWDAASNPVEIDVVY